MAVILSASLPAAVSAQQHSRQPRWEQVEGSVTDPAEGRSPDGAAVAVRDMHIYVELEQPAAVKLFTILGQPVSSMQLPAGTSRFRVPTRGIYILKIGSSTRRITI